MAVKGYYYARLAPEELAKLEACEKEINQKGDKEIILLAYTKDNQ